MMAEVAAAAAGRTSLLQLRMMHHSRPSLSAIVVCCLALHTFLAF